MCWSIVSGARMLRSSLPLVQQTSVRDGWVGRVDCTTDGHNRGAGGRAGHIHLRVAILIHGNSVPYF